MAENRMALAADGVYGTIQGEGALAGRSMVFIRLAGCSIGCELCDTDYRIASRVEVGWIADRAASLAFEWCRGQRWAWITGGEPLDRDLGPLIEALRERSLFVGLATAGHRPLPGNLRSQLSWISVSPHDPESWVLGEGDELKLVPGLAGRGLTDFLGKMDGGNFIHQFNHYFAQPCAGHPSSLVECIDLVKRDPRFILGAQNQLLWGMA